MLSSVSPATSPSSTPRDPSLAGFQSASNTFSAAAAAGQGGPTIYEQGATAVVQSVQSRNNHFTDSLTEIERYVADLRKQHMMLQIELQGLLDAPQRDALDTVESLVESAAHLEAVFARIDAVESALDNMYSKTNVLNTAIKEIQTPVDVSEKAKSLFRSLGFGSKDRSAAESGVWSRIQPRLLLDGSPPKEFGQRCRGVLSDLRGTSPTQQ
jgi:hypothetical protein